MHTLPCTTVAGRTAADRQRAMEAHARQDAQQKAREDLNRALMFYGLPTAPHFNPGLGEDRSLWVDCRIVCAAADRRLIADVMDQEGWRSDVHRLSRHGERYEVLRVRHTKTDATLVVIVKVPHGEVTYLEAA